MNINWRSFYVFLFLYRCAYSVLAQQVIASLTLLGDSSQYQLGRIPLLEGDLTNLSGYFSNTRALATEITESVGGVFHALFFGNPILINIGFQTIAFVGIVALLREVRPGIRIWLAALLMLPSFSIWSSIASKESIIVLALGIIGALIVRMYENRTAWRLRETFAFVIVALFKTHYLPALLFIIVGTWCARRVHQKTTLIIVGGIFSLAPLYLFRDLLEDLSFLLIPHFALSAGSTRPPFWVETYDLFFKAPQGMFQAFFGPTFSETSHGILLLGSFIESSAILALLFVVVVVRLPRLPVYVVAMVGMTIFWIMFANYPLGIQNPGSAIRYRTGYEILIYVAIVVLLSRETYNVWRGATPADGLSRSAALGSAPPGSGAGQRAEDGEPGT